MKPLAVARRSRTLAGPLTIAIATILTVAACDSDDPAASDTTVAISTTTSTIAPTTSSTAAPTTTASPATTPPTTTNTTTPPSTQAPPTAPSVTSLPNTEEAAVAGVIRRYSEQYKFCLSELGTCDAAERLGPLVTDEILEDILLRFDDFLERQISFEFPSIIPADVQAVTIVDNEATAEVCLTDNSSVYQIVDGERELALDALVTGRSAFALTRRSNDDEWKISGIRERERGVGEAENLCD